MRAIVALVPLHGLQLVQQPIDVIELGYVTGAEIAAAGLLGNAAHGRLVEVLRGIDLAAAQQITNHHLIGADAHGINLEAGLRGQVRRLQRRHRTGGVGAVTQQNEHALPLGIVLEPLYRQANGITDGGLVTGQTDHRLIQQRAHRLAVKRQRRLQISLVAKQDQPDPIADPPLDELAGHRLGGGQPIHLVAF